MELVAFKKTTSPIWQKSSSVTAQSVRNCTPDLTLDLLLRMELSRLLRCVYPSHLSGLERICAPADLPQRQSYFASGGWNSLAYFVAFTPHSYRGSRGFGPRTPTPGPIVFRLRRMELSRLLRCAREDLNLHGLPRYHLKVVRLPVSPRARTRNHSLSPAW